MGLLRGWTAVRPANADRAVQDMRGYWLEMEAEVPSGPDLLGSLVLTGANCFHDSTYEGWYSLPEPGMAAYLGGSVVLLWRRKASNRKEKGVGREALG